MEPAVASAPLGEGRPANRHRAAFHIASAAVSLALIATVPIEALKWISGAFAGTWWSLEITRRIWPRWNDQLQRFFRLIVRPRERFVVTSATWFTTALVLLSCTDDRLLCTIGVAVLGIGDPVAALVGRRFGRIKLAFSRTLEGSLAFVVAATVFAWSMLSWIVPTLPPATALVLAAVAAIAGAAAELLSGRLDDNLTIPLAAAASAYVLSASIGA